MVPAGAWDNGNPQVECTSNAELFKVTRAFFGGQSSAAATSQLTDPICRQPCLPNAKPILNLHESRYSELVMAQKYVCAQCEKPEDNCSCQRYCVLCQGEHNVRLVQDGNFYCLDCREACDFQAQY